MTGVRPEAFARITAAVSCSVIVVTFAGSDIRFSFVSGMPLIGTSRISGRKGGVAAATYDMRSADKAGSEESAVELARAENL
jgi:hypothetical protein